MAADFSGAKSEELLYFANALREFLGLSPLPATADRPLSSKGARMFGTEREWPSFRSLNGGATR